MVIGSVIADILFLLLVGQAAVIGTKIARIGGHSSHVHIVTHQGAVFNIDFGFRGHNGIGISLGSSDGIDIHIARSVARLIAALIRIELGIFNGHGGGAIVVADGVDSDIAAGAQVSTAGASIDEGFINFILAGDADAFLALKLKIAAIGGTLALIVYGLGAIKVNFTHLVHSHAIGAVHIVHVHKAVGVIGRCPILVVGRIFKGCAGIKLGRGVHDDLLALQIDIAQSVNSAADGHSAVPGVIRSSFAIEKFVVGIFIIGTHDQAAHIDNTCGSHHDALGADEVHIATDFAVLVAVDHAADGDLLRDQIQQLGGVVRQVHIHDIPLGNSEILEGVVAQGALVLLLRNVIDIP